MVYSGNIHFGIPCAQKAFLTQRPIVWSAGEKNTRSTKFTTNNQYGLTADFFSFENQSLFGQKSPESRKSGGLEKNIYSLPILIEFGTEIDFRATYRMFYTTCL